MAKGMTRRDLLGAAATGVGAICVNSARSHDRVAPQAKSVAAILTRYEKRLHADVLIGKILEGWKQDGGPGPALKLASMYVDQFSEKDLARELAKKYDVPIFDTIEGAVTAGGDRNPVDGVLSIGEGGSYPSSDIGQILYPRRRFFDEIADAFRKSGRAVPVFNDKHLGPAWEDEKWMYDRAREMNVPLMAGTSLSVTFRSPELELPLGCDIEAAVGIGYSHLDIYGFHALECLQCLVERRKDAETGVRWVQCLQGDAMWRPLEEGLISKAAFDAAFQLVAAQPDQLRRRDDSALFLFQYHDGLIGAVFMLPGIAQGIAAGIKLKGQDTISATRFEERLEPRFPHFAYLLKGIERFVHTGRPSYPVERTLLASGILDRVLTSRFQGQIKLETPELAIRYRPVDYPHAPLPALESDSLAPLN